MSKGRSSYFDTFMWCCSGGKNRSAEWKDLRPPRCQEGYNDGEQNKTQAHSVHSGAWKRSLLTSRFVCCSHGWWMKRNFFLFLIVSTTYFQVASEKVAFVCNRPFLPMREAESGLTNTARLPIGVHQPRKHTFYKCVKDFFKSTQWVRTHVLTGI